MIRERTVHLVLLLTVVLAISFATNTSSDTEGKKHQKEQNRPIKLGTSGGNNKDINQFFCCSGTLGALVEDKNPRRGEIHQYVLSNNHVLGLGNKAKKGDDVDQPGLIDNGCNPSNHGPVADFFKKINFKFGGSKKNFVDAAMAEVRPGAVDPSGMIIDQGIPGQPEDPALGDKVSKTGRTSGKRNGSITTLDASFIVPIPTECGGSSSRNALFVEQMIITPSKASKPFSQGGDSGSLVVHMHKPCPAAMGLLAFGDSIGRGGANTIQNVLEKLKVKIVGCAAKETSSSMSVRAFSMRDSRMTAAKAIKDRYVDQLMKIPGVNAVGLGLVKEGSTDLAIHVYVIPGTHAAQGGVIPTHFEKLPVVQFETSGFKLL